MSENIGTILAGSIIGIITFMAQQPIWLVLLLAFLTGAMSYAGRILVKYVQEVIRKKMGKN